MRFSQLGSPKVLPRPPSPADLGAMRITIPSRFLPWTTRPFQVGGAGCSESEPDAKPSPPGRRICNDSTSPPAGPELGRLGRLGRPVTGHAAQVLPTMTQRPGLALEEPVRSSDSLAQSRRPLQGWTACSGPGGSRLERTPRSRQSRAATRLGRQFSHTYDGSSGPGIRRRPRCRRAGRPRPGPPRGLGPGDQRPARRAWKV
jgi:hypothetical protein